MIKPDINYEAIQIHYIYDAQIQYVYRISHISDTLIRLFLN